MQDHSWSPDKTQLSPTPDFGKNADSDRLRLWIRLCLHDSLSLSEGLGNFISNVPYYIALVQKYVLGIARKT